MTLVSKQTIKPEPISRLEILDKATWNLFKTTRYITIRWNHLISYLLQPPVLFKYYTDLIKL